MSACRLLFQSSSLTSIAPFCFIPCPISLSRVLTTYPALETSLTAITSDKVATYHTVNTQVNVLLLLDQRLKISVKLSLRVRFTTSLSRAGILATCHRVSVKIALVSGHGKQLSPQPLRNIINNPGQVFDGCCRGHTSCQGVISMHV